MESATSSESGFWPSCCPSEMFALCLLFVVVPAKCLTPEILLSDRGSLLDGRYRSVSLGIQEVQQECRLKLNAQNLERSYDAGMAGAVVNANKRCISSGLKFCKLHFIRSLDETSLKPKWSGENVVEKEMIGCFPSECSQVDVLNGMAFLFTNESDTRPTSLYGTSHCNERGERGIGFWITVSLWATFSVLTLLGTFLDSYVNVTIDFGNDRNIPNHSLGERKSGVSKNVPNIVITRATDSPRSSEGSTGRSSSNSVRTDDGCKTYCGKIPPLDMQSLNSTCSDVSAETKTVSEVLVHDSPGQAKSKETADRLNCSSTRFRFPVLGDKSLSYSDFSRISASLDSVNSSLNFSSPSVFVSPLTSESKNHVKIPMGVQNTKFEEERRYLFTIKPVHKASAGLLDTLYKCSVFHGIKTVTSTRQDHKTDLAFFHAIRTIAVWWFLLYETSLYLGTSDLLDNKAYFRNALRSVGYQVVFNSFFHIQTIFFANAIFGAMVLTEKLEEANSFRSIFYILLKSIAEKFVKQMSCYLLTILTWTFLTPAIGSGPLWYMVRNNGCGTLWWTDFLYISNFYPSSSLKQCMPWAWYAACDMQMYVFGTALTALLCKKFRLGLVGIAGSIVTSLVLDFYIAYEDNLLPSPMAEYFVGARNSSSGRHIEMNLSGRSFDSLLNKPYYYWFTYAVGILMSTHFSRNRRSINKILRSILCVLAFLAIPCLMVLILLGSHTYEENPSPLAPLVLVGFSIAWTILLVLIALGWRYNIMKGPIHRILSASWWVVVSRLNFGLFIKIPIVLSWLFFGADYTLHFNAMNLLVYFLAGLTLTYFTTLICGLFGQIPFFYFLNFVYRGVLARMDGTAAYAVERNKFVKRTGRGSRVNTKGSPRNRDVVGRRKSSRLSAGGKRSFDELYTPLLRTKFSSPFE